MNSVRTYMLLLYAAFLSLTSGAQEAGGRVMLRHALTYVGKPYTAHTLEVNEEEQLVVNLEEVDCTTFVEYVLAQSLAETDGDRFEAMRSLNQELTFEAVKKEFELRKVEFGPQQMRTLKLIDQLCIHQFVYQHY